MNSIIKPQPLTSQERACELLKAQVLEATLLPGQRVIASDLAAKLGISRTPVREALGRLEQERLITRDLAGGYTVRVWTTKEIADLYKVREALEVEAVAEAMANFDQRMIVELKNALAASEKAKRDITGKNHRAFILASRKFHAVLASYSKNELLQGMLAGLSDKVQMIGAVMFERDSSGMEDVISSNRKILGAIIERDTEEAISALRQHIREGRNRILRTMTDERG